MVVMSLGDSFRRPLNLECSSQIDVMTVLKDFLLYSQLLLGFTFQRRLSQLPAIRRLFGFTSEADSEDFLVVRKDTILYDRCHKRALPSIRPSEEDVAVIYHELDFILRQLLQERLGNQVTQENDHCRNAKAFRPCIVHAAFRRCSRENCPTIISLRTSLILTCSICESESCYSRS